MSEKILFVTGKLAERQLKRILNVMKPEFSYKISQIGVSVAALMSENILMRRISKDDEISKIIVPGRFRGNLERLSKFFKVPVERGPDDLRNLPDYFGLDSFQDKLEKYDCLIFGEIVDATILTTNQIIERAKEYKKDGANIIDLGCMPDTKFDHLEDTVQKLKTEGFKVSIDSADDQELLRGGKAGADYLLSISERNSYIADEVDSIPILIPSKPGDMKSLESLISKFISTKKDFFADPILDPIHYGFLDSIDRFRKLRNKFPDINILMGIGNLTELTDSDSSGVNAILMGLVSELNIKAVLVVQVSNHCRNAIKETDSARKLMYFAKQNQRLPMGIDNNLMCLTDRKLSRMTNQEVKEIKSLVKDKNYRIILTDEGVNIFNSNIHKVGIDPFDFFENIKEHLDSSHAFYLGVELARAQIAHQLGKKYNQDNELDWGVAFRKDKENFLSRPALKSTQRKK